MMGGGNQSRYFESFSKCKYINEHHNVFRTWLLCLFTCGNYMVRKISPYTILDLEILVYFREGE